MYTLSTGCADTSNPLQKLLHCISKNDTDVAHYNFNAHQPILVFWQRYF